MKNPFFIGDQPDLTQTSGWADAWKSSPSAYVVAAADTKDVISAVNFARDRNLRLVVKGGGHSYQGTSNAPDSMLIWTRPMNRIKLRKAFVGQGCEGSQTPQSVVTVEAGVIWAQAYDAVSTRGGLYVQGGGCTTVGVAGLIQSGGFGSFSKNYGLAAAGLIEAEIVTADGIARTINACSHPDLFWGIKGGGGGSLGVLTKLTLRTHELPDYFGGVFGTIRAASNVAFQRLVRRIVGFYKESLFNQHWGEQIRFGPTNRLSIAMVFQGLDRKQAVDTWAPFLNWVKQSPHDFSLEKPLEVLALPARHFWDAEYLRTNHPEFIFTDDRPGAPKSNFAWAGDEGEAGQFLYSYQSAWLSASLLEGHRQKALSEALVAAAGHWGVSLHFNKGLAGASAYRLAEAKETAMNPVVLDAFALAIAASHGPPAFRDIANHEPDLTTAHRDAGAVRAAIDELWKIAPKAGSYVAESDYFQREWQQAFWGSNYERLAAIKQKYDRNGLFFVHHGVGSEQWSEDGFRRFPQR